MTDGKFFSMSKEDKVMWLEYMKLKLELAKKEETTLVMRSRQSDEGLVEYLTTSWGKRRKRDRYSDDFIMRTPYIEGNPFFNQKIVYVMDVSTCDFYIVMF